MRKVYPGGVEAVKGVEPRRRGRQFCVLVGPSGCGKSTLLRMVAGLETITSGEVAIGGRVVNEIEPADRDIAMVFQNYALYPHMSVYDNMAYGLRNRGTPKPRSRRACTKPRASSRSASSSSAGRAQLSGGQRQRVAMGRAIVRKPQVVPVRRAALQSRRQAARADARRDQEAAARARRTTSIYVTHDQLEAMTLADMLVVMNGGLVEQIGAPIEVYRRPATTFVATFIGSPPMNLLPLRQSPTIGGNSGLPADAGIVGVRPEDLSFSSGGRPDGGIALDLRVDAVERIGAETFIYGHRGWRGNPRPRAGGRRPAGRRRRTAVASRAKLHVFTQTAGGGSICRSAHQRTESSLRKDGPIASEPS